MKRINVKKLNGPTPYQKFAMSKPVGKVLDSKVGKVGIRIGNAITGAPKKIASGINKLGTKLGKDLFGSTALDAKQRKAGSALNDKYRGLPSYKKGGKVKKTGLALVHKGEKVIPVKKRKKKVKNPGDLYNKYQKKKRNGKK